MFKSLLYQELKAVNMHNIKVWPLQISRNHLPNSSYQWSSTNEQGGAKNNPQYDFVICTKKV